ncbi:MAG: hypothetical protein V4754_04985 [Pseudomonadota bacterium]
MRLHKLIGLMAALTLMLALTGCATQARAPMSAVRAFAAESAKLGAFAELTARYRDTYRREQPYLSPAADQAEQAIDLRRRAAYSDFIQIQRGVVLYMQTLGQLAGEDAYDLSDRLRTLGGGIKAWPESGLDAQHVSAFTGLARLLARMATRTYQQEAVADMVSEGDAAVQSLLEAMQVLLRTYDKSNDNERKIVLGLFEVELPFVDTPRERLLATLAKAHYQSKNTEYGLIARRYSLAEKNLSAIAEGHRTLARQIGQLNGGQATAALAQSAAAVRDSRAALDQLAE